MSSPNQLGNQLVIEACAKWSELPSLTLAKKLVADNRGVWSTVDAARVAICRRRGRKSLYKHGVKTRIKDVVPSSCPDYQHNPYRLPRSDETVFTPYVIAAEKTNRIGILSDLHCPYHNIAAITLAIDYLKKKRIDTLLINGDLIDCYQISRFSKDPRKGHLKAEVEATNQLLDVFDEEFPKTKRILKKGNHDIRVDHCLMTQAPELFDLKPVKNLLAKLLNLEERGWECIEDKVPIYAGKLTILHGHELSQGFATPVNAARTLFMQAKDIALMGHRHQTSQNNEPSVRGRPITTWSTGCLSELHPEYMPFNKWNHGFAYMELEPDGNFILENLRIINGGVVP